MGEGTTRVEGYLDAGDTRSTLAAIQALGATVTEVEPGIAGSESGSQQPAAAASNALAVGAGERPTLADADADARARRAGAIDITIDGIGLQGPGSREAGDEIAIDVGNAGTLLRILPGWLAGQEEGRWRLDGDDSIRRRPVDRIADPLRAMGAEVECRDGRLPPLHVSGSKLTGTSYKLPVASAQVKSCLLIAGLLAGGRTEVLEPTPTRDHTERMLAAAGVAVHTDDGSRLPARAAPRRIWVESTARLDPGLIRVPGDFSSAAFALVAALIVPGSRVTITDVGLNPTRIALLGILNRMGAAVSVDEGRPAGREPQGRIVAGSGPLQGTRVGTEEAALAIDELPLVALAGCFADGDTIITGAAELRHKESDRIASVVEGLRGIGAEIEALPDGMAITGSDGLRGGRFDARGDHRLAMLAIVAGLASRDGVEVDGVEAAAISYPDFEAELARLAEGGDAAPRRKRSGRGVSDDGR